ncbi:hypothetical protein B9Z19DRAFT_1080328 [Tuber borchii]|uniref:Uncharacterized protein n=1 Tax=Tuber borchii TaxID=42251 RepID=A0A2T6ZX12_TUBBO|nr:hypothetical protein B9Z19DRAFT_1080328 [Tuber borchii]
MVFSSWSIERYYRRSSSNQLCKRVELGRQYCHSPPSHQPFKASPVQPPENFLPIPQVLWEQWPSHLCTGKIYLRGPELLLA